MDEEERKIYRKRAQQGHGRVESQPKNKHYTSLISDSGLKGPIRSLLEVVLVVSSCTLISTLQASVQSGISSL